MNRINVFLKENNTKSLIQKLECQKQVLEEKQNSLQNLVIDGTIDKYIYNAKKIELNKKIKKIEKEQEQFQCQLGDENRFDTGIEKIKEIFDHDGQKLTSFDKDIFEALVYKVIIGETDKNGNKDPYVIRFIIKSGFENVKEKMESNIVDTVLGGENLILAFNSWQNFVSFKKQRDGSLRKN